GSALGGAGSPAGADPPGVGPDLFRAVLRHHAKGVAVITAGTGTPVGFCATSLASLSLDPPLVLFAVGLHTASWATMRAAPHVMVHLLGEGQQEIARRFADPAAAKFGPTTRWRRGPFDLPVLEDVLAWLALVPVNRVPVGDHALIIGRVVAAWHTPGEP